MLAPSTSSGSGGYNSLRVASERFQGRRRIVALAAAALVALAAIAVGIAALSGGDDAPPVSGAAKDVVATVRQFETALGSRDWAGICNRLYTSKARAAAGGAHCASALAQSAGGLRGAQIRIVSVDVRGQAATVTVAASANGTRAVTDAIQLQHEHGRYRIASAGGG